VVSAGEGVAAGGLTRCVSSCDNAKVDFQLLLCGLAIGSEGLVYQGWRLPVPAGNPFRTRFRGRCISGGIHLNKERGVVKWFNAAKGYGFIQRSTGEDVFVHYSAIEMAGYRSLENGAEVEFEVKQGPKGLQAENVQKT